MIFVTVGTHEQPFDRLIEYMDKLVGSGEIREEVIIQTGYSTYEPKYCTWQRLYPYRQMVELVNDARIVITHGGPSSFIMPLRIGKIPVVVPRQYKYKEHVNDHQVRFVQEVAERMGMIITVVDIEKLGSTIKDYDGIVKKMNKENISNNERFNAEFRKIVDKLFEEK